MKANLIRPAIDTLRALRGGRALDELALHITQACNHVTELGKAAEVKLIIKIKPYSQKGTRLVEQPVVMEVEVDSKLPKPDREGTIFFLDEDGNPTETPRRRDRELELNIVSEVNHG